MTRRSHLLVVLAVVALSVVIGVGRQAMATVVDSGQSDPKKVQAGEALFGQGCVTCHGVGGTGTPQGPPLVGVGAASADFMLTTGRMPMSTVGVQPPRKQPAYSPEEIDALVAYVASLGAGPAIPAVDPQSGDLPQGGELYRLNCAACHNAAGAGGALSSGAHAPALDRATALQIAEAIRIGPGQMPSFDETLTEHDVSSIARYVLYLRNPADRGGFSLSHSGPVAEGFVAWIFGIGTLILAIRWITRTRGEHR